jgi:hypothetical protein
MSQSNTTENSVLASLAGLAKIEEERVRHEQHQLILSRTERAKKEREAEAQRRANEARELEARAEEDARRAREVAMEQARQEARERAATEVARIQAEAKARLEADNAARAHELATLRVKKETGRRRREYALAALLAVFVSAGSVLGYDARVENQKLEQTSHELRETERALARERDDAKRTELSALDQKHSALLARAGSKDATEAKKTAAAARKAVDGQAPGHDQLRTFSQALDALAGRIETAEKLALLENRFGDLESWAMSLRKKDALRAVQTSRAKAKAETADFSDLVAYESALNDLAKKLGARTQGRVQLDDDVVIPTGKCREGDPGCGLDGRPLF